MRRLFGPVDAGYVVTLLLVAFSGVYITKIGVSPIYATTFAGVVGLVAMMLGASARAPATAWAMAIGLVVSSVAFGIWETTLDTGAGSLVNLVLGPVLAGVIPLTGRRLERRQLIAIARWFVIATLLITAVEAAYRLTHPDLEFLNDASQHREDVEDIAFYAYKFNSIMYLDSNFVGLQLAVQFALLFALRSEGVRVPRLAYWLTFALVCATISRASIIACLFLLAYLLYRHYGRGIVARFLVVFAIVCTMVGGFLYIQNDESFATKFDILRRFSDYEAGARLTDILFGNGAGHAVVVLGIGAHNIVVTYLIELGLVASFAIAAWWCRLVWVVPSVGYLMLVWLVNGFSLTTLADPYLYASAALLQLLHRRVGERPSPAPAAALPAALRET